MRYSRPTIKDFGPIAAHTFQTPGKGTKSTNTTYQLDKYNEYSHPAAGS